MRRSAAARDGEAGSRCTLHELGLASSSPTCARSAEPEVLARRLRAVEIPPAGRPFSPAAHKIHHHPNNFLSGVYYLRTFPGADTINFHDPRSQTGIIRPPVTELTAANTDQVVLRVHNGTLLVFPSWLQHSVDANAGESERISISFNVMFSSFSERLTRPLWQAPGESHEQR